MTGKLQKVVSVIVLLVLLTHPATAQVVEETPTPPYIKTVQFIGNSEFGQLPIIRLGDPLVLTFDDIIGDEADYFYTIEHYNADWTPSILAKSEYLLGFDNLRITDYRNSVATLQIYSHYRLRIPNQRTKRLLKSGNYLLKIFNDSKELVFSRKFMIYEPLVAVGAQIKRSRDLNYVDSKQVVRFNVDGGDLLLINPKENVQAVILKNNNLKASITGLPPQYTIGNVLEYRYDQELAFWGANEFFNFENKNVRAATNMIDFVELEDLYHNYLYINRHRADLPYTYSPDINGNFVITKLDSQNPEIDADYVWIHFSVQSTGLRDGEEVHVYGNFNNYELGDDTRMEYVPERGIYEKALLLKQGFYDYRYAVTDSEQNLLRNKIDGDFWQTENDYQILIYYRDPGARFDRLIGVGAASSVNITN